MFGAFIHILCLLVYSELSFLDIPLPALNARMSNKKVSEIIIERQAHESFFRELAGESY